MEAPTQPIFQADIISCVASFLPGNEVAATLRLVNKPCAGLLPTYVRVQLSRPVPHHVFVERWCSQTAMRLMSLRRRLQLLRLTAASGCLDNLQAALAAAGWDPVVGWVCCTGPNELMDAPAKAGHLHVCQWLRNQGCPFNEPLCAAAAGGQREVCEWLLAEGCRLHPQVIFCAARGGHMDLAESLRQRGPEEVNSFYKIVFVMGVAHSCELSTLQREFQRLEELQQIHHRQRDGIIISAAISPTPDWREKVEWLDSKGLPKNKKAAHVAAGCLDAVDRLSWLQQRGYPLDTETVCESAYCGNVAALQYLLAEGTGIEVDRGYTALRVSMAGHLPILQLLHARGWPVAAHGNAQAAAQKSWSGWSWRWGCSWMRLS